MKTFVMSDIHGCYDEFMAMLQKINFTQEDQLILLGDYIDRGPKSYEMLCWMENVTDNVLLIKGNHDAEFAQCIDIFLSVIHKLHIDISSIINERLIDVYQIVKEYINYEMFDYYGTLQQLIESGKINISKLSKWKEIIDNMPFCFKTSINANKYVFVHAGYITDKQLFQSNHKDKESFYLYAREESVSVGGIDNGIIIAGHTPTIASGLFYNAGNVFEFFDTKRNCKYFNIDCGIAYRSNKHPNAKLACLELTSNNIYYV